MAMWSRLTFHGIEGFRRDARRSQERAERAAAAMRSAGVPVLLNPHSLTLVFPKPDDEIVEEYQLACAKYDAHAVIMPSVADALIARFLYDYFEWWERENKA
jgi:histidine decarboxylase